MKIRDLDLSSNPVNAEHAALGLPPIENAVSHPGAHPLLRFTMWSVAFLLMALTLTLATRLFNQPSGHTGLQLIAEALNSREFWSAVAVGLLAQTVDGALGMAYGITSTSFLLASGSSPAVASAAVHIAEVFTTGVSGISHIKLGNVNKNLFLRLLVPGMLGAAGGAWVLSSVDGAALKPFVAGYLLLMGLYVFSKIFGKLKAQRRAPRHVAKLGLAGGFLDAVGGGGWGPIVTTTLVGTGQDPRQTIGSVNLAEFFLTFVSAGVFALLIGDQSPWTTVGGLVIGGLFAAPFAALLTARLHTKALLALVGSVIVLISSFNIWKALA
ncbi:hypothetical protein HNQ51_000852 [Inhella inkyongensis]|uniref:Probable membrane transporter protein n=1 Tax=Inhella inkyongensis TaxID=392593 RepID=A0A840S4Y0_9BURK|nr:sulfite exporter TauE/SafE family protein [Inhella inkyongensis]MBB5203559.1 hypothetical protein [Inhella inkyongensis]